MKRAAFVLILIGAVAGYYFGVVRALPKTDFGAFVAVLLAFGSAVAAAVYLMRRFGVEDDFLLASVVFRATLWIVGALVFILGVLVLNYVGCCRQTPSRRDSVLLMIKTLSEIAIRALTRRGRA